ncbi:MAG: translation initiation factor IF-2 [Bacteroidales bacterium]|nr:translation initiation factor IF-2 [Bacteroidales bacterium]
MSENLTSVRLSKAARDLNIGMNTAFEFLTKKGIKIDNNPNTKISAEAYELLLKEFQGDKKVKEDASKINLEVEVKTTVSLDKNIKTVEISTQEKEKKDELLIKSKKIEHEKEPVEEIKPDKKEKVEKKQKAEEPEIVEKTEVVITPNEIPVEEISEEVVTIIEEAPKEELISVEEEEIIEEVDEGINPLQEDKQESKLKVVGKIDLSQINSKTKPARKTREEKDKEKQSKIKEKEDQKQKTKESKKEADLIKEKEQEEENNIISTEQKAELKEKFEGKESFKDNTTKLKGPTILGKIDLNDKKDTRKDEKSSTTQQNSGADNQRKKRKRIFKDNKGVGGYDNKDNTKNKSVKKPEISEEEIQKQIKDTLARLSGPQKSKAAKYRRQKRDHDKQQQQERNEQMAEDLKVVKVLEFVTANELSKMMNVQVTEIISMCLSLGLFVSINQRLDAETISIVAEEFGYKVDFISVEDHNVIEEEPDNTEDLVERSPIVTVMGHVDHGKTKLLDFIRKSNVVAGEAGGITQHIGAYEVRLDDNRKIVFLDTPGHEAFTAMRARGAKVTDIAIIVIAADDGVMPQTIEAINHAQAAGVPIVIAITKIDKNTANPERVKEQLANINILVEDWGGKYQCQHINAKEGINIDKLLEKICFEADVLELKANPKKPGLGTVIESSLDKGRGYLSTVLVQNGTIKVGDVLVAGSHFGKIKSMFNERNIPVKEAGPATPVLILGINGAPQAGDTFNVFRDEKEAKSMALKRQQLIREQGLRTQKHITLDEIGRRIAIGDFKELNLIIKGDVDGSIEALADSLIKLSTEEVQVNVIHKSVGSITESDVSLAQASNAIIVGFQVRPTVGAKREAEKEQIDIRLYSIIYTAINEIRSAIEGMLSPEIEEKILCNIEVREVFHITKVGTVAGCMVLDGKVMRSTKIRVIRDGIVIYTGVLGSLKRFKDDVKEVTSGYECGLNIQSFNDIRTGDIIEGYEQIEIKRTL